MDEIDLFCYKIYAIVSSSNDHYALSFFKLKNQNPILNWKILNTILKFKKVQRFPSKHVCKRGCFLSTYVNT